MTKKRISDPESSAPADAEFRAAVRGVTPLAQSAVAPRLKKHAPRARLRKPSLASQENLDELMPLIAADPSVAGESLVFQRAGLRPQVMRRLRRGLYPCEDELDLHGLHQTAARDRLADFIAHSRDAGRRCVRIVHGKGYRSGVRGPVLKTAVNLWLRRHMDVMAFVSARAIDGGTGAVYVLLRG
jgi:DNA-nicking Smr family endonuclease